MKKLFLITCFLCSLALVSALVTEPSSFFLATTAPDGAFATTTTPVSGIQAYAFSCPDNTCTTLGAPLFTATTTTNSFSLTYPDTITAPTVGYGIYFVKDDYLPFEVFATWSGSGTTPSQTRYLTKKTSCIAPFTTTQTSNAQTNVTLAAPINTSGLLTSVPPVIAQHYTTNVSVTLTATNASTTLYAEQRNLTLSFSEQRSLTFAYPALNQNSTITITSLPTDTKCLASVPDTRPLPVTFFNTSTTSNVTALPLVTILSPQPSTYNTSTILINLSTVNATSTTVSIPGTLSASYTTPFTIVLTNGTYTLTATGTNTAGSTSASVTFTINTSAGTTTPPNTTDTTPPASIRTLQLTNQTSSSVSWNWTNPTDADFSHVQLFLNTLLIGNITGTNYTATGLLSNTSYTLAVFTWDNASNRNNTGITSTGTTLASPGVNLTNTTLPGPVANLTLTAQTNTSLTWNWINPLHQNFSMTLIYLNNIFQGNTTNTNYTALNLQPGTTYTLTLLTANASGSTTGQGVSNTANTLATTVVVTPGTNTTTDTGNKKKKTTTTSTAPRGELRMLSETTNEHNTVINLDTKRVQSKDYSWFIILLLALLSILLLLYLLLFLLGRKSKRTFSPSASYKMPGF